MASKYPEKTLEKVVEKPVPAKEPTKEKKPTNVKRKFVGYGLFQAELDNFLKKELAEEGYAGIEVRRTPAHTEVNVVASRTQQVLGERGNRLRELTTSVVKRFDLNPNSIELFVEKVAIRGLCAAAMCEQLRYKLCGGLPVRRACYGVLRFIMESGATGCEIVVSGKIRGQRAKAMKFVDGVMLHSGEAVNRYIDEAVRHVQMKAGVLGIRVKIMLTQDKEGRKGPREPLPDKITISELEDKAPIDLVPESLLKEYPNLQLPVTIFYDKEGEVFVPNQKQREEAVQKQLEDEQKQREEEQKKLEEAQKHQEEAAHKQLAE